MPALEGCEPATGSSSLEFLLWVFGDPMSWKFWRAEDGRQHHIYIYIYIYRCGSKLKSWGYAGFGLCDPKRGPKTGTTFLSRSHMYMYIYIYIGFMFCPLLWEKRGPAKRVGSSGGAGLALSAKIEEVAARPTVLAGLRQALEPYRPPCRVQLINPLLKSRKASLFGRDSVHLEGALPPKNSADGRNPAPF